MNTSVNRLAKSLFGLMVAVWSWGTMRAAGTSGDAAAWWSAAVENRRTETGKNWPELARALAEVAPNQREGLQFLIENMPAADLQSLSASFLLTNVALAYEAWEKAPWHSQISKEVFLNDILPYASLNEARDPWRAELLEVCTPMITGCTTPGEAAQALNRKVFPHFKVRYNTSRRRPDQSPRESIETGTATCTGLAILLVDACRAVGIPARVAGTPMWSNMRGNHTWVEVWDNGWHFTGAAEPDKAGLDHSWFVHDASEAQKDVPQHAIYASSFQPTGIHFPLVWLPGDNSVNAVNVTDRYTGGAKPAGEDSARLAVKVLDADGKRVAAQLAVTDLSEPANTCSASSRGESADMNDLATFKLVPGRKYRVIAKSNLRQAQTEVAMSGAGEQLITLKLSNDSGPVAKSGSKAAGSSETLSIRDETALRKELEKYFAEDGTTQAKWKFSHGLDKLLVRNEAAVRQVAWDVYRNAPIHAGLKSNFDAHIVTFEKYTSPYTVKKVGDRPAKGWPLFIAMHGGGGAPKALNDSQWKQMQIYYKEHPECGGYLYLALRAPNDTWNGFYDDYVYPLVDNLIRQFRLFGDIDPDKVFIMGYSHGGYGAYAIGPKMPDHFAAIHASAAAATDGETTPRTLRTTPFTVMVGEKDTMYGRYERNVKFKAEIEKLRGSRTDIYPVTVTIVPNNGHTGLPDRDKIRDLYPTVRNPVPREVDWMMTDKVVHDLFWLHVDQPAKQSEILASCRDNRFVVTAGEPVSSATVYMDSRLINFSKPVDIELNGSTTTRQITPSLKVLSETLARRGDPGFAFSAAFEVTKDPKSGRLVVARTLPR